MFETNILVTYMNARPQTQKLFDELSALMRLLSPSRQALLHKIGLSKHQLLALYTIATSKHPTIGEIADQLAITSGAATQMIDLLEAKNLIERRARAGDRRVIEVSLTTAGTKMMLQIKVTHQEQMSLLLSELSDEELIAFIGVVQKVRQTFERHKKDKE